MIWKRTKEFDMRNNNVSLELILFSNYSPGSSRQKDLVKWLTTTAQPAIGKQQDRTKKIYLRILKDSPPIHLS